MDTVCYHIVIIKIGNIWLLMKNNDNNKSIQSTNFSQNKLIYM